MKEVVRIADLRMVEERSTEARHRLANALRFLQLAEGECEADESVGLGISDAISRATAAIAAYDQVSARAESLYIAAEGAARVYINRVLTARGFLPCADAAGPPPEDVAHALAPLLCADGSMVPLDAAIFTDSEHAFLEAVLPSLGTPGEPEAVSAALHKLLPEAA